MKNKKHYKQLYKKDTFIHLKNKITEVIIKEWQENSTCVNLSRTGCRQIDTDNPSKHKIEFLSGQSSQKKAGLQILPQEHSNESSKRS